jgi:ABC-type sugar transport system ATPase subunit
MSTFLVAQDIDKSFGATVALDSVQFELSQEKYMSLWMRE